MPVFPRFDLRGLVTDAARFARAFPAAASSLARPSQDPLAERLVEGMYFLGGTLLDRVEDLQAHAYEALGERVCPWLQRPIPSATVVAFEPPASGTVAVGADVPFTSVSKEGVACTFRLLAAARIGAFRVSQTRIDSAPGRPTTLRFDVESAGTEPLNALVADGLNLYFDGELESALRVAHAIVHEAEAAWVESHDWAEPVALSPSSLERTGLAAAESLAPDPDGLPPAFGAVTDAFVFPHKFRFVRALGLGDCRARPATRRLSLVVRLRDALPAAIHVEARAHCAVAVNLFETTAEPIPLRLEADPVVLRIAGAGAREAGVYAVQRASARARNGEHPSVPLPDLRRLAATRFDPRCPVFFSTFLEKAQDDEPQVAVRFGVPAQETLDDAARVVSVRVWATNRAAAESLRAGDLAGTLTIGRDDIAFRSVVPASRYVPPPTSHAFALKAVRHATVRRGDAEMLATLKDALFLAAPAADTRSEAARAVHLKIDALRALEVTRVRRAVRNGEGSRLGYGYRVVVDETAFRGPGEVALFGAALGEALTRTVPVNTFAELTLTGANTGFAATFARTAP